MSTPTADSNVFSFGQITDRILRTRLGTWLKTGVRWTALQGYEMTRAFWLLPMLRWATWIILNPHEMRLIYDVIYEKAPCNVLVFGLGDDSPIWAATNAGGHTVFIEDNAEWIDRMLQRDPSLNVYHHSYTTTRRSWEELLSKPEELSMDLPSSIGDCDWDVILVDAPAGYEPDLPGRMQSIYTASALATPGADVFVHDIDRTVEDTYSREFFGSADQIQEIDRLRHYRITL